MLYRYSQNKKGQPVKTAVIYTEKEHCIKNSLIDSNAIKTIRQLRDYGYEAYIVGGAVRDLLLHKKPKDFDLVTNATPTKIKKIFRNSRIIGKRFRIVHIFYGSIIFEVTTFRSKDHDTYENVFGSMDEDVFRRDFTINALFYDPVKSQIIDYVNGVKDIQKKKIVPVIPLKKIFNEDPVRMIRAIKYAASTSFTIPFLLQRKICQQSNLLSQISASRLTEELLKIINSGCSKKIIQLSVKYGLFIYLQPAASNLVMENQQFSINYFNSLQQLDELQSQRKEHRLGEKLKYLIFDFVKILVDVEYIKTSKISSQELYINTWKACRNFILPMNPQRTELDYAVRSCLKLLGVTVLNKKKSRFLKKNSKPTQK